MLSSILIVILTSACSPLENEQKMTNSADIKQTNQTTRPNILFILVDDLGWRDLSSYGSDFYQTPYIDKLAASGTRFNQAYTAASICSPTRMSLLTGKHPARLKVTDWIPGWHYPHEKLTVPKWNQAGLAMNSTTIGDVLQTQNYKTAWFGKWHVRGLANTKQYQDVSYEKHNAAQLHGFDAGGQDFSLNNKKNEQDPKGVFNLTDQAIDFIDKHKKQPWFVTISHYSVHTPVHFNPIVKEKYQALKQASAKQQNAEYAAMIEPLDQSVGQILNYLDQQKLTDNTLIIFYSDNGGLDKNDNNFPTNNAPLRNGKASLYEGGIRVPLIASWPGKIPANVWNNQLVSSVDMLPTFAAIAGVNQQSLPADLDGIDISDTLFNQQNLPRNTLYWHYPHYHRQSKPVGAIRDKQYKLLEFFDGNKIELYDLKNDIGETHNLASQKPQLVKQLREKLNNWRAQVGAQSMTKNPNYDPNKAQY